MFDLFTCDFWRIPEYTGIFMEVEPKSANCTISSQIVSAFFLSKVFNKVALFASRLQ